MATNGDFPFLSAWAKARNLGYGRTEDLIGQTLGGTNSAPADEALKSWFFDASAPSGSYTLSAAPGEYVLTGLPVAVVVGRSVSAEPGSYALTGSVATITRRYAVQCAAGSYTLSGSPATVVVGRTVLADAGSYALTGSDAAITVSAVAGYTVACDPGAYVLAGSDAAFTLNAQADSTGALGAASQKKTYRQAWDEHERARYWREQVSRAAEKPLSKAQKRRARKKVAANPLSASNVVVFAPPKPITSSAAINELLSLSASSDPVAEILLAIRANEIERAARIALEIERLRIEEEESVALVLMMLEAA